MKKKLLLFSLSAGLAVVSLSSYKNGPAGVLGNSGGLRTGSNGKTCVDMNCHGTTSANTLVTVKLTDKGTNQQVTDGKYKPLRSYEVELLVANSTFSHFGFQAEFANSDGNSAGLLQAGPNQHVVTLGNKKVIEHTDRISGNTARFTWVSPHAGTGTVKFYAVGNAVSNNTTAADDVSSPAFTATFAEAVTSVAELDHNISVKAYPNPLHSDMLHVSMEDATTGDYTVTAFDLTGRKLTEQVLPVVASGTKTEVSINTANWPAGLYNVQLSKDGAQRSIPVIKY